MFYRCLPLVCDGLNSLSLGAEQLIEASALAVDQISRPPVAVLGDLILYQIARLGVTADDVAASAEV